jgi:hypothetical protein
MEDAFTRQPTFIRGPVLPDAARRTALQDDHWRRLEALSRLRKAAAECSFRTDSDRDLILLEEDEVGVLAAEGGIWAELCDSIKGLRRCLPIRSLAVFGFLSPEGDLLEVANPEMRLIGGGVEAWAFEASEDNSIYKFYLPRNKRVGSEFGFLRGSETVIEAKAGLGNYRALLEKLLLIQLLGGMPTEVIAITKLGVLVAKQTLGAALPQGEDMSRKLPEGLIEIPSRFIRADRDHPRLFFVADVPYLVADLHARNFVRGTDGELHLIDLVAGRWPKDDYLWNSQISEWMKRVHENPDASALPAAPDGEL